MRGVSVAQQRMLWGAMLIAFPVIAGPDIRQAPQGCAQLC
jgi:hypothetical protein